MTEPARWPNPDPGWKVRSGVGLLAHAPMSPERRDLERKAEEREAAQMAAEAELRAQQAAERLGELRMAGVQPTSVQEVCAREFAAEVREARAYERKLASGAVAAEQALLAADQARQPPPKFKWWQVKRAHQEAEAAAITTPATVHALDKLAAKLDGLQSQYGEDHAGWH